MTDLPPEEAGPWKAAADAHGLATIFLVAPTSTPERIALIARNTTGFVYCVSRTGVTGARTELPPELQELLARIRAATDKPLCVGFGISQPDHVAQVIEIADGAVIGSALVDFLHAHADNPHQAGELTSLVRRWKESTHRQSLRDADRSEEKMYTKEQFGKTIDNTLLRPTSTRDEVLRLCEESAKRHFASVCILPCWVGAAARALAGSDVKVCTVVGFPFGATTRLSKVYETKNAIANGAQEIDAVMNLARFKSGDFDAVLEDLRGLVEATRPPSLAEDSRRVLLKVIIETCYLSDEEKDIASQLVRDAGADFVKTSTGTAGGGATTEDIRRIRRAVGPSSIGIKASGGIKTVETALQMLDAGRKPPRHVLRRRPVRCLRPPQTSSRRTPGIISLCPPTPPTPLFCAACNSARQTTS